MPKPKRQEAINHATVYAQSLLRHSYGYALWTPEPVAGITRQGSVGVRIGDVGYVNSNGSFESLFNVRAPQDVRVPQDGSGQQEGGDNSQSRAQRGLISRITFTFLSIFLSCLCVKRDNQDSQEDIPLAPVINTFGEPTDFEPLRIDEMHIHTVAKSFPQDGFVTSEDMENIRVNANLAWRILANNPGMEIGGKADFVLDWKSASGAVLHLPKGAYSRDVDRNYLQDYAIKHAQSWYEFVNGPNLRRGLSPDSGKLILVTGYHKSDSWFVGAFSHSEKKFQASVKAKAMGVMEAGLGFRYECNWAASGSHRTSDSDMLQRTTVPKQLDVPEDGYNQTIFVRGWHISVKKPSRLRPPASRQKSRIAELSTIEDPATVVASAAQNFIGRGSTNGRGEPGPSSSRSVSTQSTFTSANSPPGPTSSLHGKANSEPGESAELDDVPNTDEPYHPCTILNDFLLQTFPEAVIALSHDDDWSYLTQVESSFRWEELAKYVKIANGAAFFEFEPTLPTSKPCSPPIITPVPTHGHGFHIASSMDIIFSIGLGLSLRAIVSFATEIFARAVNNDRFSLPKVTSTSSSVLIGLCESVVLHYSLQTSSQSFDPYIAYVIRLLFDLLFARNMSSIAFILIWTCLGVVLLGASARLYQGYRQAALPRYVEKISRPDVDNNPSHS